MTVSWCCYLCPVSFARYDQSVTRAVEPVNTCCEPGIEGVRGRQQAPSVLRAYKVVGYARAARSQ